VTLHDGLPVLMNWSCSHDRLPSGSLGQLPQFDGTAAIEALEMPDH
jgi:hypothetical protein